MYPEAALKAHVQGVVTVEATLDSSGNVIDAHVMSGPQELRRAVLQSVLQWHFAMDSGSTTRRVNINFTTPQETAPAAVAATGILGGIISSVPSSGPAPTPPPRKGTGAPSLAGKTLSGYVVNGLSDQARADLLSRLPVHQGDTLAEDSFDLIAKAVRDYDEHLTVGRVFNSTGEVRIMIAAPGANYNMSFSIPAPPPSGDTKRITIGGNVQQAKLISQPKPVYPPLAKQARIQGVVQMQAVIGVDGAVKNLQVISGHPLLVAAAMEAVQQWTYQQTLLNGQPVEVLTQIDVNFTLTDQPPQQ
jgi:TonB family protein